MFLIALTVYKFIVARRALKVLSSDLGSGAALRQITSRYGVAVDAFTLQEVFTCTCGEIALHATIM